MQQLTMQQTTDYLDDATIEQTIDVGHAIIHAGINAFGVSFVLVNDMHGNTAVTEGM